MKEYGSSVQKLVDYIMTIDEEEKRTKYAFLMVELMKQIHPNMKDSTQDYSKKLWDDLFGAEGRLTRLRPEKIMEREALIAENLQKQMKTRAFPRNMYVI
jgi:hypothetical protein